MHYFLENQTEEIQKLAKERRLAGPVFVGQGCTQRCGSDSYGYFVAEILKPGRLVAIVCSESEFVNDWTDGSMTSRFPSETVVKASTSGDKYAFDYIMKYGKSWYKCRVTQGGEIKRLPGVHCGLSWNGAFDYRDPSF